MALVVGLLLFTLDAALAARDACAWRSNARVCASIAAVAAFCVATMLFCALRWLASIRKAICCANDKRFCSFAKSRVDTPSNSNSRRCLFHDVSALSILFVRFVMLVCKCFNAPACAFVAVPVCAMLFCNAASSACSFDNWVRISLIFLPSSSKFFACFRSVANWSVVATNSLIVCSYFAISACPVWAACDCLANSSRNFFRLFFTSLIVLPE